MSVRVRFLLPVLLIAFSGCYTQLRAPDTADRKTVSPRFRDTSPPPPSRVDVYPHPSFPAYFYDDPWDGLFYRPYRSRWTIQMRLLDAYNPYWMSAWYLGEGYVSWGVWHPTVVMVPDLGRWHVRPPRPMPSSTRAVAPRPRIRRAGFGADIPSARDIREPAVTVRASGSKPGESSTQTTGSQRKDAQTSPSQPSQPAATAPPAQKQESKDDEETSEQEKREEKREEQRRRGGMR